MKKSYPDECLERAEKITRDAWWACRSRNDADFIHHAPIDIVILAERLKRACQVLRQAGHSFIDIEGKEMEAQICRLVADELEKMPEDEK